MRARLGVAVCGGVSFLSAWGSHPTERGDRYTLSLLTIASFSLLGMPSKMYKGGRGRIASLVKRKQRSARKLPRDLALSVRLWSFTSITYGLLCIEHPSTEHQPASIALFELVLGNEIHLHREDGAGGYNDSVSIFQLVQALWSLLILGYKGGQQ